MELNPIFNLIPEIVSKRYYWNLIKEGLVDIDGYCRKITLSVLKANI
jgi:hypothetical protein